MHNKLSIVEDLSSSVSLVRFTVQVVQTHYAGTYARTSCILPRPQNFTNNRNAERRSKCRAVCQDRSVYLHVTCSLTPTHLLKIRPDILILNLFHSSAFFRFKLPCLLHQLSLVLGNRGAEIRHESFHWPGCRISTLVMTAEVMGDITVLVPIVTERCSGEKARQAGRHPITQPFPSKRSLPCL